MPLGGNMYATTGSYCWLSYPVMVPGVLPAPFFAAVGQQGGEVPYAGQPDMNAQPQCQPTAFPGQNHLVPDHQLAQERVQLAREVVDESMVSERTSRTQDRLRMPDLPGQLTK